jgi:hypothetical protein
MRACGNQFELEEEYEFRQEELGPPRRHRVCRQNRSTRARGEGLASFSSVIAAIDALTTSALLASSARHDALWAF